jgi:hypothetical protein
VSVADDIAPELREKLGHIGIQVDVAGEDVILEGVGRRVRMAGHEAQNFVLAEFAGARSAESYFRRLEDLGATVELVAGGGQAAGEATGP